MKLIEPALDLSMCMAIVSSFRNIAIPDDLIAFGEVGLSGEVRSVNMPDVRISEALRLGFKTCIVPKAVADKYAKNFPAIRLIGVSSVQEAVSLIR
jgi:DNA repair protein RadA/Sms